ncbi:FecCD family ABC transporter permease [Nakamurella alba]|uniref:FecCD family ABC transporter permease n=1 Tax=Nakamurella alba TaxID=2665158 RepID=UPI002AC320E3|nr:iron ABC transporter permease [Nakamurella alba]
MTTPIRETTRTTVGVVLATGVALLCAVAVLGVVVGSTPIGPGTAIGALLSFDPADHDQLIARYSRWPRVLGAIAVGASTGAAGAVMQAVTRNPLADPGILGVNAGASLFVVAGIQLLGIGGISGYLPLAFAGAAVASVAVYLIGAAGRDGPTPVTLTLAGAAFALLLGSLTSALLLIDQDTRYSFLFWTVGSVAQPTFDPLLTVLPFLVAGLLLALALGGPLNVMALGEQLASALGLHTGVVRALAAIAVVLLCGGATALAGPIGFVGLIVPFVARLFTGPDHRWIVPLSAVLGGILVVLADLLGRTLFAPAELRVGVVTALIGAPVFILLARRRRVAAL